MTRHIYKFLAFLSVFIFITSCDIKEKGIEANESSITIESKYGNDLITNYESPFVAKNKSGNEISSQVTFYVDNREVPDENIIFTATGTHKIKAKISLDGELLESNELSVEVTAPRHSTKILVEDFTGTWCVNCPRMAFHLEEAVQQNSKIIPVAVHNRGFQTDPFHFSDFNTFRVNYGINSFPTALCNRLINWNEQMSQLQTELDKTQAMGLSVNSSVNNGNINIEVKTRFDLNLENHNLFLVVYITENGLIHDQANATSFYGGQNPIPNFVHNHTLRIALTGVNGTAIPHDKTNPNQEFVYNFQGPIPSEISDINNCEIVAFVGEEIAGATPPKIKVFNIQKANIGNFQDFD